MKKQIQNKVYLKQMMTPFALVVLGIFSSACPFNGTLQSPEQNKSKQGDDLSKKRDSYSNPMDTKTDDDVPLVPQVPIMVTRSERDSGIPPKNLPNPKNRGRIPEDRQADESTRPSLDQLLDVLSNSNSFTGDQKNRIANKIIELGMPRIEGLQRLGIIGEGDAAILNYIYNQIRRDQIGRYEEQPELDPAHIVIEPARQERVEEWQPEAYEENPLVLAIQEQFMRNREESEERAAARRRPWAEDQKSEIEVQVRREMEQAEAQKKPTPKELEGPVCSICQGNEEPMHPLKCCHYFHVGCIRDSLVGDLTYDRVPTCPVCRRSLDYLISGN